MPAVLVIRAEARGMRALGHLSSIDLLEGVDTGAFGVKGVHEMHGCGSGKKDLDRLLVYCALGWAADWGDVRGVGGEVCGWAAACGGGGLSLVIWKLFDVEVCGRRR